MFPTTTQAKIYITCIRITLHIPIPVPAKVMNPALPPPAGPAAAIIARYNMSLIPNEGAWFAVGNVSQDILTEDALPERFAGGGERRMGNTIMALVTERDFSALHRLRTEETWHFYDGDPLDLLLLEPDGNAQLIRLGRNHDVGELPQFTVRPGTWMGARPAGRERHSYSFFGCSLWPGFDYSDYEHGRRAELQAGWPAAAQLIAELTREANPPTETLTSKATESGAKFAGKTVPNMIPAPGLELNEIVGRAGAISERAVSMSRFRLSAGASTGRSRYLAAAEFLYILVGTGSIEVNGETHAVSAGDTLKVPRGQPHALFASTDHALEFLAVISPAFDPRYFERVFEQPGRA